MIRDPQALTALITSLDVRNNPLFLPGKLVVPPEYTPGQPLGLYNGNTIGVLPYTRCNGFAGVVFAALGSPIPWKQANELLTWFAGDGKTSGWIEMVLGDAPARANAGLPVAIVATDVPHGHIAVGVPCPADPLGLYCAAAGSFNTACARVADQFGKLYGRARYFWHV